MSHGPVEPSHGALLSRAGCCTLNRAAPSVSAPPRTLAGIALIALVFGASAPGSFAQSARSTSTSASAAPVVAEQGKRWRDLRPNQREALKPLENDWHTIDANRKQKWVEIADRFGSIPPAERVRIQERMTEWAKMSPLQRGQVRLQFQEAQRIAPQDRQAQWEAYQALPAEQKQQLANRAAGPAPVPVSAADPRKAARPAARGERAAEAKSNIVPNPSHAEPPHAVAPTVVQAGPGVSTTLISRRPAPPAHQQTGLPKIAATPGYVNSTTLLPQRGPQGAATRPAPAPTSPSPEPGTPPRKP
jgi:hypothetical protein